MKSTAKHRSVAEIENGDKQPRVRAEGHAPRERRTAAISTIDPAGVRARTWLRRRVVVEERDRRRGRARVDIGWWEGTGGRGVGGFGPSIGCRWLRLAGRFIYFWTRLDYGYVLESVKENLLRVDDGNQS
jgi:hypothetical protein